jgi:hypothetical protein
MDTLETYQLAWCAGDILLLLAHQAGVLGVIQGGPLLGAICWPHVVTYP